MAVGRRPPGSQRLLPTRPANLAAGEKEAFILFLEVAAQCLACWFFEAVLGHAYWAFVDNMAARFSLLKGYSRDRDANAMVSLCWGRVTVAGSATWFEHVPSKAQLADAVSRQD